MKSLIERGGAVATIAPSMREIPLDNNPGAFQFAEELLEGRVDVIVFMTGVGATALVDVLETRYKRAELFAAMEKTTVVVRGPKPTAVLRNWGVRIDHRAPEPNTWEEVLDTLEKAQLVSGRRVAIQEYGQPSTQFYEALQAKGATVSTVPVYRWALPDDIEPLRTAVRQTIAGEFDVLMFTSAQQLNHVLEVAERDGLREQWLAGANKHCFIASIGPTATANLLLGLRVDFEPSHSTMGNLVKETLAEVHQRTEQSP
jgi:uroporphyrinogen-III synthase